MLWRSPGAGWGHNCPEPHRDAKRVSARATSSAGLCHHGHPAQGTAALLLCPVVSEPATLFSRMYAWTERSVQNCFSFLDFFFPFNQVGLIVLSQQLFLRWAFCQFYSLVSCINHIAHLRSQQSATQTALKSRTFLGKHIHLSQGTDGRTNPAFARSRECAALF